MNIGRLRRDLKQELTPAKIIAGIVICVLIAILGFATKIPKLVWNAIEPGHDRPNCHMILNDVFIYRISNRSFPICALSLAAENESDRDITVRLATITLFKDSIKYDFSVADSPYVSIPRKGVAAKRIVFSDHILDEALTIPQNPGNSKIEVRYFEIGAETPHDITMGDENVVKCSYWQLPKFETIRNANALGLKCQEIDLFFTLVDTLTNEKRDVSGKKHICLNANDLQYANFDKIMAKYPTDNSWILDSKVWMKKYGGVYFGLLRNEFDPRYEFDASGVIGNLDDYAEDSLFGLKMVGPMDSLKEFIYYTYDLGKSNPLFDKYDRNSRFYIFLLYERADSIQVFERKLSDEGYRVESKRDSLLDGFFAYIRSFPPDMCSILERQINLALPGLNSALADDQLVVVIDGTIDSAKVAGVISDLEKVTGRRPDFLYTLSKRMTNAPLSRAPFATYVLVSLNFSDLTRKVVLDSFKASDKPFPDSIEGMILTEPQSKF